jgi:hypothetical protein
MQFQNEEQIDAFLSQLVEDSKSNYEERQSNYIKLYMNKASGNLGSITLLPILAKQLGSFYKKLYGVKEWYGPSSIVNNDDGYAFYKVLPRECYGELTPEQEKLYADVVDKINEANDTGEFGYDGTQELRFRSYSLFTGIVLSQKDLDKNDVEDNINKAVLAIYPSAAPVQALQGAINAKQSVIKDKLKPWLMNFLNPSLTNRNGVITISFTNKSTGQPGYDSTVGMELNSDYSQVVPPEFEISEEQSNSLSDPIKLFLGWQYDWDNESYFNETVFKELLESLTVSLNTLKVTQNQTEKVFENKNGNVDPMKSMPEVPGVTQPKATTTVAKSSNPFDNI